MDKKDTYFVDIDGTIFVYRKFETYKSTEAKVIESTKELLIKVFNEGHTIVLTTARPEEMREHTEYELSVNEIPYNQLVMGIGRGIRYLINDMDPNKLENRAIAVNLLRDEGIKSESR